MPNAKTKKKLILKNSWEKKLSQPELIQLTITCGMRSR